MTQLELFGDVDAGNDSYNARIRRILADLPRYQAAFEQRCQVGTVRLLHDCMLGKTGELVPAWICPDCGKTELTEFMLEINHGWSVFSTGWCGLRLDEIRDDEPGAAQNTIRCQTGEGP